jgi:hypothetical protein
MVSSEEAVSRSSRRQELITLIQHSGGFIASTPTGGTGGLRLAEG